MRVDVSPRRRNAGRPAEKSAPQYLQWVRGRRCFLEVNNPGHVCEGKVRACHFDPWGDKGMGTKASDRSAIPMCDGAHREQTDVLGWPEFQKKYGFDGRHVAVSYWLQWPGRLAWEVKNGS